MTRDASGEVAIPNNMIQIKLTENSANAEFDCIRRSGKLYDRQHHTYDLSDISGDNIECDIVWEFDWIDLPEPIQNYVTARASTFVSQRIVGSTEQYSMLQQQEALSRALALEYETQQGQFTFFGHPQGLTNYYQSYQPFHALQR